MNASDTCKIIEAAGGGSAFARLLGLDKAPGFQQRVSNWKRRGMPAAVVLEHKRKIDRLLRAVSGRDDAIEPPPAPSRPHPLPASGQGVNTASPTAAAAQTVAAGQGGGGINHHEAA